MKSTNRLLLRFAARKAGRRRSPGQPIQHAAAQAGHRQRGRRGRWRCGVHGWQRRWQRRRRRWLVEQRLGVTATGAQAIRQRQRGDDPEAGERRRAVAGHAAGAGEFAHGDRARGARRNPEGETGDFGR